MTTSHDLEIINADIVDDSGAATRWLGVRDGRLIAIGEAPGDAREVIDANRWAL